MRPGAGERYIKVIAALLGLEAAGAGRAGRAIGGDPIADRRRRAARTGRRCRSEMRFPGSRRRSEEIPSLNAFRSDPGSISGLARPDARPSGAPDASWKKLGFALEIPAFSQCFLCGSKRFQGLSILRKFGIPNFYLDRLRNIKRLGSEKFGKRGIFNFSSDGRRSFISFRDRNGCRPAKAYRFELCGGKTEMSRKCFLQNRILTFAARRGSRATPGGPRNPQNRSTHGRSSTSSDQALRGWRSTSI